MNMAANEDPRMASSSPAASGPLARLPAPPPPGSIQFFDGYFPMLTANSYQVALQHSVVGPGSTPSYTLQQTVVVQAPEFTIDQGIIQSFYPPDGGSDIFGETLPYIVLDDAALPWERSLVPGTDQPDPANPLAWMALLVFAEGEIRLQPGSNNPVSTATVQDLVNGAANLLKPHFPDGWLSAATLASQCQTITVAGDAFAAVAPQTTDLPYLAHCRAVRSAQEGEALLSVLLANRLTVADTRVTPAVPLRYYAHLVSLEGYGAYLGPNGTPIPPKTDVMLVSLANWSFVSLPQSGQSFAQLMQGLIRSQSATPSLALPVADPSGIDPAVVSRLADGFAPLDFVAGSGDQSFAWYRGPFTPVVPQSLPPVGSPAVDTRHAGNADALMVYLAGQGMFDLSYAAAWTIGRGLALADSRFAQSINSYRQSANAALGRLSQRLSQPQFAGAVDMAALAAPHATRQLFTTRIAGGLGTSWTQTLGSIREGVRPPAKASYRAARRSPIHPRDALALPGAGDAISANVADTLDEIANWLANLSLLRPVPFSHLVPDPRMLPTESIRFFYVDQSWIDAAIAGALSIAVHGSADVALLHACRPRLNQAIATRRAELAAGSLGAPSSSGGTGVTGMLIRSQIVSGWPQLVVAPTLGGAPLPVLRNDCPSPTVRLVLFDGVPDKVTLAEPYQGLRFGVEDDGVYPRCVTLPAAAGAQIANAAPVPPSFRTPPAGAVGGVLQVAALAATLESAAGVLPYASDTVVHWNGTALSTNVISGRQVSASISAGLIAAAGTASITVTTKGATAAPVMFTIDAALSIDALQPGSAGAGTGGFTLTVQGNGFGSDAVVHWHGTALATTIVSVMEVTARVPAALVGAPGTAAITVTSGSATSNGASFTTVGATPGIDALEPSLRPAGGGGFTLTVLGSGFVADSQVLWNGTALATRIPTAGQVLAAAVPATLIAAQGSAAITVSAGDERSAAATFTIAGASPTLGGVSPAVALAGGAAFTLIVDGVNFAAGAVIGWNGNALATTVDDDQQLTATVPASMITTPGAQSITVRSGGTTSNALPFAVIAPAPAIGLLEPASAVAGTAGFTLTVTAGFGSGDFAVQIVRTPESQAFLPSSPKAPTQ